MSTEANKLSVLGHIGELRNRLVRSVIVVAVTVMISFAFYQQLFQVLLVPAPPGISLQAIKMTEMIGVTMRVVLISGFILAMPYLTYELIMFVSPGLTRQEKKYVYLILPWIALMFAAGVAFAYFVLVPRITGFLISWGSDIVSIQPTFSDYVNVVTRLLLAVGLVFEMPVVTTFLARIGIIKPNWLSDRRKPAIIVAFILAAMITPTIDPINQTIIAVPLIGLYEMSIWLAKLAYKRKGAGDEAAKSPAS
ncbi:MAG: twin-arginine translocase subunit TatC [Dehalococcoidales bacterium]|nr:twin-arginine translocase subunit TatC [Dehalococcoidales bacterium]